VPFTLVTHPVAQDALISLRDTSTMPGEFRRLAHRVALIVAAEATRDLPTTRVSVRTPLEETAGQALSADVVVVAVLRAGLCLVEPVLELLPRARVGHIGLRRDEQTAEASQYSSHLPEGLAHSTVFLVDPMLATGGSAVMALDVLKNAGARSIRLLCVVAAPEGVAAVARAHPEVTVYAPALDRELNPQKFIAPGLGDFGDRLYGTGSGFRHNGPATA
jgi:uracil phosphoribosyltransferase